LEFDIGARRHKSFNDGATRWSKKFKIGLVVYTGCDGQTDGRTRCRSKDPAYYVARVKTECMDDPVVAVQTEKLK